VASSPPSTRADARREAIARLRAAGSETAVLDADLLLAFAVGVRKEDVYAHPEAPITGDALRRYDALVERRARGEPVAYLRGVKEFYGLDFAVDARVLIPRPETELLVDEALRRLAPRPSPLLCDLGTGSGAVAVALALRLPRARVIAIDSSAAALAVARANAERHGVADHIELRAGDLLVPITEQLDAVVANLPYLTTAEVDAGRGTSIEFEPREALDGGPDGLAVMRSAIAALPAHLAPGGIALFECGPAQALAVAELLRRALGTRGEILRDPAGRERVVVASRVAA
jgi:release factor glutamine methyltransferase